LSLIRPSPVENLYLSLFQLEPDRPRYYINVIRLARSIFLSLGFPEKVEEMNDKIRAEIEVPFNADFVNIVHAFDNPRFMFSRRAYTRIGDSIDYKEVTRYDMENRLEAVKDWVYDNITEMSQYIRFTRQSGMMA